MGEARDSESEGDEPAVKNEEAGIGEVDSPHTVAAMTGSPHRASPSRHSLNPQPPSGPHEEPAGSLAQGLATGSTVLSSEYEVVCCENKLLNAKLVMKDEFLAAEKRRVDELQEKVNKLKELLDKIVEARDLI